MTVSLSVKGSHDLSLMGRPFCTYGSEFLHQSKGLGGKKEETRTSLALVDALKQDLHAHTKEDELPQAASSQKPEMLNSYSPQGFLTKHKRN